MSMRFTRRLLWPALTGAVGVLAWSSVAAPAAIAPALSITKPTAGTSALRPGELTVRATRLSAARVRVTMLLRVRARRAVAVSLVAYPCQTATGACSVSNARRSAVVMLHAGANRLLRSYVVHAPGGGATACGAGEAVELRDTTTFSLVRVGGKGTALKRCPA
jgi:hypothetical protein